jgi:hypothetical protein
MRTGSRSEWQVKQPRQLEDTYIQQHADTEEYEDREQKRVAGEAAAPTHALRAQRCTKCDAAPQRLQW